MSDEQKPSDSADKAADGAFLAWVASHPTATLASGEGALLLAENDRLRERLTFVEAERDGAYGERNRVVAWAARMALALGFDVTVTKTAIHGWDTAWHNCIYVQTPEGQVSWHFHDQEVDVFADFPRGAVAWDGHSTLQKYDRVRAARYINRAERILAALREPSFEVAKAAAELITRTNKNFPSRAIRAAVAAAEQEVGRE